MDNDTLGFGAGLNIKQSNSVHKEYEMEEVKVPTPTFNNNESTVEGSNCIVQ